jgi:hypothetical protein
MFIGSFEALNAVLNYLNNSWFGAVKSLVVFGSTVISGFSLLDIRVTNIFVLSQT